MVLSGTVNKRLVSQFLNAGIRAVGISGEDGALLQATLFNGGSLGAVGAPALVNAGLLEALMDAGYLPVISPLGRGPDGNALNVNGDDAAASIAAAIDASELLLVADVPGVLDASGDLIKVLHTDAAEQLISTGIAKGGMAAKLDAATRGLLHGVARVRIGNMDAIEDTTAGTSVFLTPSVV
jgi:acetylglutamate kinase